MNNKLVINHSSGFFSCCSVRLHYIVKYINDHNILPVVVDSSKQFELYKKEDIDITFEYFKHYDEINKSCLLNNINYIHDNQFMNYSKLEYDKLIPLITKYFSPTDLIIKHMLKMEEKYKLVYDNICVLFYRGNDKITETPLCDYEEYIKYADKILLTNPNIKFLIQSDETEFINLMCSKYPNNSFYFKDEIRHMTKCNSSVDLKMKETNYEYSKLYLAITLIMSKCKYIICGSGNCSIWIMLYRGNCKNVYQNLNRKWYEF